MQGNEICRGARHRILILTYISWLTLSLAPTIVAPPERGFVQGQPEMQQAMDNMVAHGTVVKKRMNAPPNDDLDYHAVLTSKTSNLLTEAEHVLSSLPVSKERQWIEAFVRRMRAIAAMLEKTAQNKNQNSPKNLSSVSGTPVPEGLPLQPTWPATSAVPGINPFQKQNRMMSKFPVTSPELSQVLPANEYPSERQAVTKPAVLSNKKEESEDDELVKELESLHQEFVQPEPQQNSKVLDQVPIFTTPSTVSSESQSNKLTDLEGEKASLKAKLIQEIAEFQRLGGVIPNEVIHALYTNNQKATGLAYNQKSDIEDKLKYTEAGMVDEPEIQRLNDFNIEDREISNTNLPNMEKNMAYQAGKHIQPLNFSHSFQNINPHFHPNLHALSKVIGNHFQYMSPQSKEPPYEGHENAIHGLHQPHPYNKQEQYHAIVPSTNQHSGHIPDALKQMLSKPQNKMYHEHLAASNYNEYLMKHGYGPYPYMHNWDKKNLTHHLPMAMPPYQTKQPVSHQIDTQLSDEMKRQLRDGKIIVLSDSVVRSNFEPNNDEKSTENKPDKPENAENKNNTTTSN